MNIFLSERIENEIAFFSKEESFHAIKVLRLKIGDEVNFIDGNGRKFIGKILLASKDEIQAKIESSELQEKNRNYFIHLAIAPTKNSERIEWMIEKAVEIGIDEISFLLCERSERKVVKIDRIKKIIESAVKQSLQTWVPKVNSIRSYSKFLEESKVSNSRKLIAHCDESGFNRTAIKELDFSKGEYIFLIGPEGDFSKGEIELALNSGFDGLELGKNRLRTETAGLYVCMAASCRQN